VTYEWLENNLPVPDSNSPTLTVAAGHAAGDFAYVRVAANAACTVSSNTYTVRVNAAPTAPTGLSSNPATICNGTSTAATLTATGGSTGSGAVYEWGTGSTVGSNSLGTTAGDTYSVSLNAATTYWVRLQGTGACSSASTTDGVTVAVTGNVALRIYRFGGDASQTVNQYTAINAMTYTAISSSTATMSMSSGSLPSGVTGIADGSSYTISGTPTEAGTFSYSLTAAVGGCTRTAEGTITVNEVVLPPDAASTKTWEYAGLTWSDRIIGAPAACSATATLSSNYYTLPAQYKVSGDRYYYNWACVDVAQTDLCPSPWSVPTKENFDALASGGPGYTTLSREWDFGGFAYLERIDREDEDAPLWSNSRTQEAYTESWLFTYNSGAPATKHEYHIYGFQVRCVK
jgi:hypothetical protein